MGAWKELASEGWLWLCGESVIAVAPIVDIKNSYTFITVDSIVALLGCLCCSSVTHGLFVNMYSHVTLSFVLLGVKSKSHK